MLSNSEREASISICIVNLSGELPAHAFRSLPCKSADSVESDCRASLFWYHNQDMTASETIVNVIEEGLVEPCRLQRLLDKHKSVFETCERAAS